MTDDQLSKHERIVLQGVEDSLRADDSEFVERFKLDALALDDPHGDRRRGLVLSWLRRRRHDDGDGPSL
jgi:hypothetical protein